MTGIKGDPNRLVRAVRVVAVDDAFRQALLRRGWVETVAPRSRLAHALMPA